MCPQPGVGSKQRRAGAAFCLRDAGSRRRLPRGGYTPDCVHDAWEPRREPEWCSLPAHGPATRLPTKQDPGYTKFTRVFELDWMESLWKLKIIEVTHTPTTTLTWSVPPSFILLRRFLLSSICCLALPTSSASSPSPFFPARVRRDEIPIWGKLDYVQ